MPSLEEAVSLGLLQGITEFLPISADGHVTLAETLLAVGTPERSPNPNWVALHALLQAGTLLAGLVYFHERLFSLSSELWGCLKARRWPLEGASGWDAVTVLVASVPAVFVLFVTEHATSAWHGRPMAVGFGFILMALALTSTLWARPGTRSSVSLLGAVLLGLAQGFVALPGTSRCALTLTVALWLELRPERAFEIALPSTLLPLAASALFQLLAAERLPGSFLPLAAGGLVALLAGLLGLHFLRRALVRGYFAWFALWMLPLALATLALAKAWPR